MGLLDFIFGKTPKIEHHFFGEMQFVGNKRDTSKSYFECSRFFKPKNKAIDIAISGDISGPTQTQIDFFENIENHYAAIVDSIIPVIEDVFRNWKEEFTIKDFFTEFEPVHLLIPDCKAKPVIWEIAFETEHDENHMFTIIMEDFTAKEVQIDG